MTIILKGEQPQSWNRIYSGRHWRHRADEAKRVHALVADAHNFQYLDASEMFARSKSGNTIPTPASVDITITAFFKGRQLDADNIASKFYIDGLKGWLIKDDSPEYVRSVTTRSMVDKLSPRVEIEIREVVE